MIGYLQNGRLSSLQYKINGMIVDASELVTFVWGIWYQKYAEQNLIIDSIQRNQSIVIRKSLSS